MKRLFNHTFLQTLFALSVAFVFGKAMPVPLATFFYTISSILKDLLLAFLPLAIFFFIGGTLRQFEKKGFLLMVTLVVFELCSNACASFAAYGLSFIGAPLYAGVDMADHGTTSLLPFFTLNRFLPSFWRVEYGTLLGVVAGLVIPCLVQGKLRTNGEIFLEKGRMFSIFVFSKIFARVIPLFIFGFFIHLIRTTPFSMILQSGRKAVGIMAIGVYAYVLFLFWMGAGFSIKKTIIHLKHSMPAGIVAFSSMSSAATMPITIQATEKNLKNPSFAGMIIPATTNIQQVGDCFIQVFLCGMMLSFFGQGLPDLPTFLTFLVVFVLARFTTAGVVGGAIFIMLPIYQTYLGFNAEMTAVLLTFNMLLDPIVTSSNVMGNSALCVVFERVWNWVERYASQLKKQPAKT
jgi:Na+/H+-dicarboxylate symporter